MPLVGLGTDLERKINYVVKNFTHENFKKFAESLPKKTLRSFPDMANCDLGWVLTCIMHTLKTKDVKIKIGKTRWPWSSAIAWTYGEDITFNSRKTHTIESIVGTIAHELTHIADNYDDKSFGHGSNSNQDQKQGAAPMVVSDLFTEYFLERFLNGSI